MNDLITKYGHYTATDHIRDLAFIESIEDTYSYHARDFVQWARARRRQVNYETVKDYLIYLNQSDYSAGTKRIKRQAVKKRIRQLMQDAPFDDRIRLDMLLADLDTFGETKAPKVASNAVGSDKVVTETERMLLISRASERLGLIMEFLYLSGCRVSEMTGIKMGHCKKEGDAVRIRVTGKGNKQREVRIKTAFYDRIRDYFRGELYLFETSGGKPYSRSYVSDQIRKLARRELGRTLSAHCFRHSFATRKIRNTGNLKGVSEYLGHSSTSITSDMYDHNLLSDADLLEDSLIN